MKKTETCVSFLIPVLFAALAVIIWASILDLPLVPGLLVGAVIGLLIGGWYYGSALRAKKSNQPDVGECLTVNSTILTIILFADLFASVMVWTVKELF